MPKLLLATRNEAKVREYLGPLRGIPYDIVTLSDAGIDFEVEETGATLEENASMKAAAYAAASGLVAFADDSGLEVDALGGEPGPLSARYAGEGATAGDLIELLLSKLVDVPWDGRTARFRCVVAIATPHGGVEFCQGECPGIITFEPKGEGGFGYDPVFYLPELGKTMAELSLEEKNEVSHRGRAARAARPLLEARLSGGG